MGKAAKFKKLRRLAAELTPLNRKIVLGERLSGKELMGKEKEIEKATGKPFDSRLSYTKKEVVEVPLNHFRNMKKAYNKYGAAGVNRYEAAVKQFVNHQTVK